MIRTFFSCLALLVGLSCLPGCGGNEEAEFTEVEAQSEEDKQAAEDYEKQLEEQEQRMREQNYGG